MLLYFISSQFIDWSKKLRILFSSLFVALGIIQLILTIVYIKKSN